MLGSVLQWLIAHRQVNNCQRIRLFAIQIILKKKQLNINRLKKKEIPKLLHASLKEGKGKDYMK